MNEEREQQRKYGESDQRYRRNEKTDGKVVYLNTEKNMYQR